MEAIAQQRESAPSAATPFRRDVLAFQGAMQQMIAEGIATAAECPLTHRFLPPDATYGCAVYAREIFLPKGSTIVGKIHKHTHLAFLLKGIVVVATERGVERLEAPHTWISEAGVKRALYVEEDAIVTTVHLTEHHGEDRLAEIEGEVIAKTYEEFEQLASVAPYRQTRESLCLG